MFSLVPLNTKEGCTESLSYITTNRKGDWRGESPGSKWKTNISKYMQVVAGQAARVAEGETPTVLTILYGAAESWHHRHIS
jgi:hypothetical protein